MWVEICAAKLAGVLSCTSDFVILTNKANDVNLIYILVFIFNKFAYCFTKLMKIFF